MYVNSSQKVTVGNSISGYIDFATEAEYNAAVCLTHSSVRTTQIEDRTKAFIIPSSLSVVTKSLPETGEEDVLYLVYDESTAPAMKEYLWHSEAWVYLGLTDVDLSGYLKSGDISDWAKAENKPTYTASEVGAAKEKHTHTKSEITDFPTLGTAAGKNATDFYPAKAANVLGGDYNDLKTNGIFEMQGMADNPTTNTPNGAHANNNFYVQVFVRSATYLTQIATSVRSDKTQYIRSLSNGVWNDWEKIKSGDADTLDGKHASDFAADITAAITDIEIGGRNLLYYSRFDKKYPTGWAYSEEVTYTFDNEVTTLTKAETATRQFTTQASVSNGVGVANPNLVPENGCTYTISCEVMKAEGYDVGSGTKITVRYNFTDGTVKDFDVDVSGASETVWTKYSRTFAYSSEKTVRYTQFIVALGAQACGIKIRNVKFEKGNKPTDWSPALEEIATTEFVKESVSSALGVGLTRDNVTTISDESVLGIDVNSTTVKQKLAVKTTSTPYVTEAVFENTTYGNASTRQSGLMSAEDKSKLASLEERIAALEAKLVDNQ